MRCTTAALASLCHRFEAAGEGAKRGVLETIEWCVRDGADPHDRQTAYLSKDVLPTTTLMAAVCAGQGEIVGAILRGLSTRGPTGGLCHLSDRDSTGATPLLAAVDIADVPIVRLLVRAGADVNATWTGQGHPSTRHTDPNGLSVLHTAVAQDGAELLDILCDEGPHRLDVNVPGWDGQTALEMAIEGAFNWGEETTTKIVLKLVEARGSNMERMVPTAWCTCRADTHPFQPNWASDADDTSALACKCAWTVADYAGAMSDTTVFRRMLECGVDRHALRPDLWHTTSHLNLPPSAGRYDPVRRAETALCLSKGFDFWARKRHNRFPASATGLRAVVFCVMCVFARSKAAGTGSKHLPEEMWNLILRCLRASDFKYPSIY
tara:strand:- start:117 stop:1253 length:1137 start_codon:yes stop_codon:yes gene_type:complete